MASISSTVNVLKKRLVVTMNDIKMSAFQEEICGYGK